MDSLDSGYCSSKVVWPFRCSGHFYWPLKTRGRLSLSDMIKLISITGLVGHNLLVIISNCVGAYLHLAKQGQFRSTMQYLPVHSESVIMGFPANLVGIGIQLSAVIIAIGWYLTSGTLRICEMLTVFVQILRHPKVLSNGDRIMLIKTLAIQFDDEI